MRRSTQHLRIPIAARQEFKCAQCRQLMMTWEIDHVVPLCAGGYDDIHNLQALCPNCHSMKTKMDMYERSLSGKSPYFDPMHPKYIRPHNLVDFWLANKNNKTL